MITAQRAIDQMEREVERARERMERRVLKRETRNRARRIRELRERITMGRKSR